MNRKRMASINIIALLITLLLPLGIAMANLNYYDQDQIAQNTTWVSGTVVQIHGLLNINPEARLTIQNNVTVRFDNPDPSQGAGICVFGSIRAMGSAAMPILFEPANGADGSRMIPIMLYGQHSSDSTIISHCIFSGCERSCQLFPGCRSRIRISDCWFKDWETAISATMTKPCSSLVIQRCTFDFPKTLGALWAVQVACAPATQSTGHHQIIENCSFIGTDKEMGGVQVRGNLDSLQIRQCIFKDPLVRSISRIWTKQCRAQLSRTIF